MNVWTTRKEDIFIRQSLFKYRAWTVYGKQSWNHGYLERTRHIRTFISEIDHPSNCQSYKKPSCETEEVQEAVEITGEEHDHSERVLKNNLKIKKFHWYTSCCLLHCIGYIVNHIEFPPPRLLKKNQLIHFFETLVVGILTFSPKSLSQKNIVHLTTSIQNDWI